MDRGPFPQAELDRLPDTGRVVVGVSGGADSCALSHWLAGRIPRERLLLAHVNHGLRGEEALRDEAFVRDFAGQLGLQLQVERADTRAFARERGLGLEEAGRMLRYGFFARLAPGDDDRILTAHTADDNAETVLLRAARGTGPKGLGGIPPARGKVLRPFLGVTRAQTEAYCRAEGIPFVTDSSNLDPGFSRNRVRLEVLPALRQINPRAVEAIARAAALQREMTDFVEDQAEALLRRARLPYGLSAQVLGEAPAFLRQTAVKRWLEEKQPRDLEEKHIQAALAVLEAGGAAPLPGGWTVRRAQGVLSALRERAGEPFRMAVGPGENRLPDGRRLVLTPVKRGPDGHFSQDMGGPGEKIHNLLFKNGIDCAIIKGELVARSRLPGDRFARKGAGRPQPLKRIFQELGMPPALRSGAVLLETGGGLVFCEGAGAGAGCGVTEATRQALAVEILPGEA